MSSGGGGGSDLNGDGGANGGDGNSDTVGASYSVLQCA